MLPRPVRLLCTLLLGALLAATAAAQPAPLEASVKAAYLYKFTGFVEWPDGAFAAPTAPIVIGVAGADEVHAELELALAGRTAQERPLLARRLRAGDPLDGVHMLFLGSDLGAAERGRLLQAATGRPLLVVTDDPVGLAAGGALNFVNVGGRVRFEASQVNAQRAGLRLSARLLGVAERVVQP